MFGTHNSPILKTVVGNGSILASGNVTALATEQIGIFKVPGKRDYNAPKAVANPTIENTPVFFIGKGRHDYPAQHYIGANVPKGPWVTNEIHGNKILDWKGTRANKQSTTDVYTIGYDGVDASKRLSTTLNGRDTIVYLRLWGGPIQKLTGNNNNFIRQYVIDKGCWDACKVACVDDFTVADEVVADSILEQFRKDKFHMIPISNFVKVSKLKKCNPAEAAIGGLIESTQYTVTVCDAGNHSAQGVVAAQYPGFKVVFESRAGAFSTYKMWRLTSQGAPAALSVTLPVSLATCGVCPAGYTTTAATTSYTVGRIVPTATDLTTPTAQQTYADSVGTAYGAKARGVATLSLSAAGTGYTNGTFPLTFSGGGGTGATGTITVVGGIPQAPVITARGNSFTSAPTVTAPGVTGGTGFGTITATIQTAPTVTSKFVSLNDGVAIVTISVPATTNGLTAIASDTFEANGNAEAICTPPAGSTVAWVAGITRKVAPKSWSLTLADTVCGATRLPELQQAYPDLVVSEEGTTGLCSRVYITTTYSEPVEDDTCSPSEYGFKQPDNFLFNTFWKPYVAGSILANPDCDPEDPETVCCAVGLKFEAAAYSFTIPGCSYGYYSYDVSDVDPVYIDLSMHSHDWNGDICETDFVVTKLRGAEFATGSGKFIQEFERDTLMDDGIVWSTNNARNDAYGFYLGAKQEQWYDTYTLTVAIPQSYHHIIGESTVTRQIAYTFAFPVGSGKAFESLINTYVLSLDKGFKPVTL